MLNSALTLLLQALSLILFFNRWIAGVTLKLLRGHVFDEVDPTFEPTVTVVVPMFNEGAGIRATLESLLALHYPADKLEIVVVDDCSTDDSHAHASAVAKASGGRLKVVRNPQNMGKRRSINRAVRQSRAEVIISVDSDVTVDREAVRHMVARFTRPDIAAVGGWVDVRNKYDNWLTRMQTVKYFLSYHFLKNIEWAFQRVMCLSGCLTAYRREVLVELEPVLENRAICGVPIKYGEDRFLTRQIIKAGYRTTMSLDAVCWTEAPTKLMDYFSQQLRWRRSNVVDYVGGMTHVWQLNPIVAVHYFTLFAMLIAYPALLASAIASDHIFPMLGRQVLLAVVFGMGYWWKARKLPMDRVSPLALVPLALILPVIYALLTPLALFTLDSGSWETRHHEAVETDEPREGEPAGESALGAGAGAVAATVAAVASGPATVSASVSAARAELPAA
ncbi:MAG TPA: glycosyltransferase [Kofleriaceae bacterium]|nr:glycosyltransferase [Kofleriaceae bacterium]